MNPQDKKFKALQNKWYSKLKDSGFNDIERDGDQLKTDPMQNVTTFYNQDCFEAKQTYYRMVGEFLHNYKFEDIKERLIWELHSEGVSIRDSVIELKKRGYKAYKRQVHETIQKLVKEMYLGKL